MAALPEDRPAPAGAAEPAAGKGLRRRQRQKLIEATISALHTYGPSRTTVDKVVSIADMSPSIVNFYFDSKAAMLVAALQFLADEFEQRVLAPVNRLYHDPVRALELLVDLYLDPEIASPRKVSVWYAFWGEASARQEYQQICGKQDAAFSRTVHELVGLILAETDEPHLDAGGIALGLIGALEMLWQEIAFQSEEAIDRVAARRRCMAYLGSVLPRQFGRDRRPGAKSPAPSLPAERELSPGPVLAGDLPGWAYHSAELFNLERERLFLPSWQFVGREPELKQAGAYLTFELMGERALVVRDRRGKLHAFRNLCRHRPHALASTRAGRFAEAIVCPVDGWRYELGGGALPLQPLPLAMLAGSVFVAFSPGAGDPAAAFDPLRTELAAAPGLAADAHVVEWEVAADWKALLDQLLDSFFAISGERRTPGPVHPPEVASASGGAAIAWRAALRLDPAELPWTAHHYRSLLVSRAPGGDRPWRRLCFLPNLLVERRPEAIDLLQILPLAPGRARLRRTWYGLDDAGRDGAALRYLGERLTAGWLVQDRQAAESMQLGLASSGYVPGPSPDAEAAPGLFNAWLRARLPQMAEPRG